MTDHSRAVQAIQAKYHNAPLSHWPTDAEIEQVLREKLPQQDAGWVSTQERLPDEDELVLVAVTCESEDHDGVTQQWSEVHEATLYKAGGQLFAVTAADGEHEGDEILGWRELPPAPGAALPASSLRERLAELVEFWRDKHTTGGIPFGDVADLLKEEVCTKDTRTGDGVSANAAPVGESLSESPTRADTTKNYPAIEGDCPKCGKPRFDPQSSTICSAMIGKVQEFYCSCGTAVTFTFKSVPPKGDVAAPPQESTEEIRKRYDAEMAKLETPITQEDRVWNNGYRQGWLAAQMKAEAPAEPVAQPQESIEAHQPIECRSRYCAQHRDIWRHYEDVIAKAEPIAAQKEPR